MTRSLVSNSLRSLALAFAFLVVVSGDAFAQKVGEACSTLSPAPRGMWCDPVPGTCGILTVGTWASLTCAGPQAPVCGCDGETYFNDCSRVQAKKAKFAGGACIGSQGKMKR
ncbi:MAG: Kazal domain-containing protein [Rhizobiales bacterium]|jgi:hypothetical protein|nr:Kazal domain-containing protein [Hyphomicrobiales bacterium]